MKDRAIIYIRVSTEDQRRRYSPETQRKDLKSYADANKLEVVKVFEEARSGWKERARVEFSKMIKFFKENQDVKHVIAREVKRLYRNIEDPAELFRELKGLGTWIHTLNTEPFNVDDPSHYKRIADHKIEAIKAEEDSAEKSFLIKTAFDEMVSQGKYPSMAPVGYLNNPITKNIEIDKKRAPMIKKLFQLYATGNYSIDKLFHLAKNMGLTNKKRNKQTGGIEEGRLLSRPEIHYILENPFYYGTFRWAKKLYDNKGTYQPIITKQLYDKCQAIKDGRTPKGRHGSKSYLFKNLLKCGVCGWNFIGETKKATYKTNRANKEPRYWPVSDERDKKIIKTDLVGQEVEHTYYRCSGAYRPEFGKHKKGEKTLYLKEETLEQLVLLDLSIFVDAHKKGLDYIRKEIDGNIKLMEQSTKEVKKSLMEQKTKLESKRDDIVAAYSSEDDSGMKRDLKNARLKIIEQLEEINSELARIEEENTDFISEGLRCIELCKDLKEKYLMSDLIDRNIMLRGLYRTIEIKQKHGVPMLDFHYNEPFKSIYEEELYEEVHADDGIG